MKKVRGEKKEEEEDSITELITIDIMSFSFKRKKNTGLSFLILFLILWSNLTGASVSSPIKGAGLPCNGTFSTCFLEGSMESEGEVLRPYATPGRWLQSQQQNTIGYKAL